MADIIRHARAVSPWFVPNKGGTARDLHGIFDIAGGATQDSEDVYVIGKQEKCGTDKGIPEGTVSVSQYERGEINSYLTLANLAAEPVGGIDLADFSSALVDVVLYEKDAFNGNLEQSIWFPKTAISSLSLSIADPEARVERSFELVGDNELHLNYNNKYLIHKTATFATGDSTIDCSDPEPVEDDNNSGQYMLRVDRTRAGETTSLTLTTDYTYATNTVTIVDPDPGDVYNVYYSANSWGSGGDPTTVDSADPCFIKADSVTVLISDGSTELELDLLTSLTIDVTINRIDEGVIGNEERILREISDTPVTVSLSGRVKDSTILEAFMGQLGNDWGITDINLFVETVRVTVKVYSDATKATFLMGYQVDNISFTDDNQSFTANEFGTLDVSGASDNLIITTTEGDLT